MNVTVSNERKLMNSNGVALSFPSLCTPITTRHLSLVIFDGFLLATVSKPAQSEILNCSDAEYLIKQSTIGFTTIREDAKSEHGGFLSTFNLPGAEYCTVIEDVEKVSYRCTWKYTYGDEQARYAFRQLASDIVSCLGDKVTVSEDQAVNHPDSYESYLIELPDSEARVTFKNKSELKSSFVSFFIESIQ